MSVELKVPSVGESITEVVIGEWQKKVGERVRRDEILVLIETDKVTVELPAPVNGVLKEIRAEQGATSEVGAIIGVLEDSTAAEAAAPPAPERPREPEPAEPRAPAAQPAEPPPAPSSDEQAPPSARAVSLARVMPAARRALHDTAMDPEQVTPTGPGGRMLKEDVLRAAESSAALPVKAPMPEMEPSPPAAPPPAPAPAPAPRPVARPASVPPGGERQEEVVAMTPMRKRIAERLVESLQRTAQLTTFNEVDMSAVSALRKQYQEQFQQRYGIKLGIMSFFVKAAIEALKAMPEVNAEIRGTDVVYKNYFDIGIAVGSGKGLVVPIVRSAERLSFAELELQITDYGKRAQDGKLKLEELQGGTFTISNGGIYGNLLSTPIINPPQSAILGLHAIQDRPVVRDGQIVIRPMMYVAVSYDHRLIDGREAVTFLKRIKECVEQPSRILLEI